MIWDPSGYKPSARGAAAPDRKSFSTAEAERRDRRLVASVLRQAAAMTAEGVDLRRIGHVVGGLHWFIDDILRQAADATPVETVAA